MSKRKNTASLEVISTKIRALEKKTIANVVEIGRLLTEASEQCEHGQYEKWLETNFDWSLRTALRYRRVFEFSEQSQIRQIGGFKRLNISLSAVHLLTEYIPVSPYARAIIKAAQKGRVSYGVARMIIDEVEAKLDPKPPPVELLPEEGGKAEEVPPPPSDIDIKDDDQEKHGDYQDWLAEKSADEPVKLLQRLDELLRHQHRDWVKTIKAVGPVKVHEIVNLLKAALDEYGTKNAVKAKADAAEAKASHMDEVARLRHAAADIEQRAKADRSAGSKPADDDLEAAQ